MIFLNNTKITVSIVCNLKLTLLTFCSNIYNKTNLQTNGMEKISTAGRVLDQVRERVDGCLSTNYGAHVSFIGTVEKKQTSVTIYFYFFSYFPTRKYLRCTEFPVRGTPPCTAPASHPCYLNLTYVSVNYYVVPLLYLLAYFS